MAIVRTLKFPALDETVRNASKWFILTFKKNQNLVVINLKCVTYAQPIHVPLILHMVNDLGSCTLSYVSGPHIYTQEIPDFLYHPV